MPKLVVTAGVTVPASPQQVWDVAMDWSRQHEWMLGTDVRGGTGVGAQVEARTGLGPAGFTDTMVITEWDPPRRCVVRHTGQVLRGEGVFEVVERAPGSEFRWTERLDLPLASAGALGRFVVMPAARILVAPPTRIGLASSLRRFARLF